MTRKQKNKKQVQPTWLYTLQQAVTEHGPNLIVFAACFTILLVLSFIKVSTATKLLSFPVDEYEVGQVSDRTVVAERSLPKDEQYPFEIVRGEKIIKKGFPITEEQFTKVAKLAAAPAYIDYRSFFNDMLFFMLLSSLLFYLYSRGFFERELQVKEAIFLSCCSLLVYGMSAFGFRYNIFSYEFALPVILPATFTAILVTILFNQRTAVYYCFVLFFLILSATDYALVPAIFELCSCLAAVRIVRNLQRRYDMVIAALMIAVLDAVFMLVLHIIFNNDANRVFGCIAGVAFNGFISGILALGFITPLETLLNTASIFRLMDLSDQNSPILRRLLLKAPGTYNHSMMVATLAESACSEIGANALLARVGAYYHDIGKMDQAEYFVENQAGENKHDDLDNPRLSLSVIRSHVKKGVEKAHQLHLPQEVIDIIAEHHGNSVVSYFYNEAKKLDENVRPEDYSYIGNPPHSREAAVVMLADTVEAACRTLDHPSVSRLEKFIHQLVMGKIEHGQLERAKLSFGELTAIEASFVTILAGYYHTRIEYPDQKDPDATDNGEE
ncbi:MAG: HDIG domain-containing protein [Treponemataceae bacterium]|nr:HDIG domain-containing protein [Treponemataceae bacterium]